MKDQQIIAQSKAAYGQWQKQWREHAKIHYGYKQKSMSDFEFTGVGKAIVCIANGYSLEEQIETLKENRSNVDILCVDKTLGHLLDHGIVPDYCIVCDANVDYVKYLEPWKDKLKDTILFINVCGNPKWTAENWKDKYFFVNKDVINSELEFSKLSGCLNFIPAGTNVSNAAVVLLTQSDNTARRNFFGYDKIILMGYDFSWRFDGKYYAFDADGGGKAQYMRHSYLTSSTGKCAYTSGNLTFSRDWLLKYVKAFNLPVVQCYADSLLQLGKVSDLKEQLQYRHKVEDQLRVKKLVNELKKAQEILKRSQAEVLKIGTDHYWAHAASV